MSMPLIGEQGSLLTSLTLAVAIGIGFGFASERAGLANARKLVAQFYGRDLTVLKVMFSALLVAMLGVFWLSRFGLLNLAALYVPSTYLLPQLVGGLIFGAGMLLAGLCPGTACASAATGRIDGAVVLLGLWVGMLLSGLALPHAIDFYLSTPRGAWTVPQWLDLPYGWVVAGVVAMALAAFALAEWWERRAT